jgi:thiamine biosynthesis protein ThiS
MMQTVIDSDSVRVEVNGDQRALPRGTTLGDLLRSLALDPRMVVIEHNRTILRDRSAYDALVLRAGDTLEIVHFVGGG